MAIIVIVLVVVGVNNKPDETSQIKIGFIGPLTGEASAYGLPVKQGIELALQDAIQKGTIKDGQIEIIWEDGKCDGKEATKAAQKLINVDKVKIIFGGQCSGETLAIAPITEQNGVLLISSFSTSPDVTKAGDYVFRIPPSDANSGKATADLIIKDGYKKVGIISEQTLASQTIIPIFGSRLKELGGEVIYSESFLTGENNLNTLAIKVKQVNPEALYINVQTGASGSRVTKSLRDIGYKGQLYTYFITGDDFVKSGLHVNGIKIVDFRAAKNDEVLKKFMDSFVKKFNQEPDYPFGATLGYDTGEIIFEAIDKVGTNSEKIKNYLYNMKTRPSITGDLSFDQNGDPVGNDVYFIRQIVDNKLVDVK